MRQKHNPSGNSVQETSDRGALLERLEALERRVSLLEAEVLPFRSLVQPEPPKRGVRPKLEEGDLLGRRNSLVSWLEALWPHIGGHLVRAKSASDVRSALGAYKSEESANYIWERADTLCEFLASGRFHRKPPKAQAARALDGSWLKPDVMQAAMALPSRQIASALAGVPELSWRTSFDRCMRKPCQTVPSYRIAEAYRILYGLPWPREAEIWAKARQGEPWSQCCAGVSYAHGLGVEKNLRQAVKWFELAAIQGNSDAQIALAEAYRDGNGVRQSIQAAYLWAAQVPMTPALERWKGIIARAVPRQDWARVFNLAPELRLLMRQFHADRGPLTVPPSNESAEMLIGIRTFLEQAKAQISSQYVDPKVGGSARL